jgi:hypothetical protein
MGRFVRSINGLVSAGLLLSFVGGGCHNNSAEVDSDESTDLGSGSNGSTGGVVGVGGDGAAAGGESIVVEAVGGSDGLGGVNGCAESSSSTEFLPANLLFVVDKSGSMKCNPPPFDTECIEPQKIDEEELSKWEITQQALTGPQGAFSILGEQEGTSVGLITFPLDDHCEVPGDGEVSVPIAPLTDLQFQSLESGLNIDPDGQTPLAGAAIRGLEAIRRGIHSGDLAGNNYLVIMTDGAETCQEAALETLLTFVGEAHDLYNIRTYAIGAPGSEGSRGLLSEIAYLGGTSRAEDCSRDPATARESCHNDLTESANFEADLGEVFHGITEATSRCEFDVPQNALIDLDTVNVEFTPGVGEAFLVGHDPQDEGRAQCEGAEGWQYTEDGTQIVLCGSVCAQYLTDFDANVRVVFGCNPTIVK